MKKKSSNVWKYIGTASITTFIILFLLIGGVIMLASNDNFRNNIKEWLKNRNAVLPDEQPDEVIDECDGHENLGYGQDCEDWKGCCKEGFSCSKAGYFGNYECMYNYPRCDYVPFQWEALQEMGYTWEEISDEWTLWEQTHKMLWYNALKSKNKAYIIEHIDGSLYDFPCRCPDGTDTREVYLEENDFQYIYCIENPAM